MEATYENTYWCNKGKHETLNAELTPLIPAADAVPNADENPALETFRVASNCYYDLYNNGLCNRGREFHETFGFDAFDVGLATLGDDDRDYEGSVDFTQELIDRTESRMDEIILAAHAEQFPEPISEGHCKVHGNWINKGECHICVKDAATLAAGESDIYSPTSLFTTAKSFRDAVAQIDFSAIPGAYESIPWAEMDKALGL